MNERMLRNRCGPRIAQHSPVPSASTLSHPILLRSQCANSLFRRGPPLGLSPELLPPLSSGFVQRKNESYFCPQLEVCAAAECIFVGFPSPKISSFLISFSHLVVIVQTTTPRYHLTTSAGPLETLLHLPLTLLCKGSTHSRGHPQCANEPSIGWETDPRSSGAVGIRPVLCLGTPKQYGSVIAIRSPSPARMCPPFDDLINEQGRAIHAPMQERRITLMGTLLPLLEYRQDDLLYFSVKLRIDSLVATGASRKIVGASQLGTFGGCERIVSASTIVLWSTPTVHAMSIPPRFRRLLRSPPRSAPRDRGTCS